MFTKPKTICQLGSDPEENFVENVEVFRESLFIEAEALKMSSIDKVRIIVAGDSGRIMENIEMFLEKAENVKNSFHFLISRNAKRFRIVHFMQLDSFL